MSLQSLPGPVSGNPHWSTIGSDRWLLNSIDRDRGSFLGAHPKGRNSRRLSLLLTFA